MLVWLFFKVVDLSEDEMLARRLAMESNREWFDRDHEMAVKMAEQFAADEPKVETEDNYLTHLLLQEQMEALVGNGLMHTLHHLS